MIRRFAPAPRHATARVAAVAFTLTLLLGASTAFAGRDRTAPTAPGNLRVTATTAFSASLAWNPSSDKSSFSYVVHASNGQDVLVNQSSTSLTFTAGLEAAHTYSFYVFAVDASGNRSRASNTVSVTLPRDTTPPTTPVLAVTEVGATHVSLLWAAQDDGPYIFYQVYVNGSPFVFAGSATSITVTPLEAATTYTFTVKARDNGINWSEPSNTVTVTTEPPDPDDVTPPTTPGNLRDNGMSFPDGETWLFWDQSTDDQTPQSLIQYDVYLNGVLDHTIVGFGRTILYATVGVFNTIEIVAVDAAGNQSPPATYTVDLR
jgi:chitinase